jgi:hypothetical protein
MKWISRSGVIHYLTEEGDGFLVQGLGVSDIAADHPLEGERTSVCKFLNEQRRKGKDGEKKKCIECQQAGSQP